MKAESFIRKYYKELLFGLVLFIGTTLLFIFFSQAMHIEGEDDSKLVGIDAPEIEFEAVDGSKASLKKNKGNVILVNFWASWCLPCIEEMPQLKTLENHFASKGFLLLAINMEEKPKEKVKSKIARNQMPDNLIYNVSNNFLSPYKIKSLPISVLIDREGKIHKVYTGTQNWMKYDVIREIDKLLE